MCEIWHTEAAAGSPFCSLGYDCSRRHVQQDLTSLCAHVLLKKSDKWTAHFHSRSASVVCVCQHDLISPFTLYRGRSWKEPWNSFYRHLSPQVAIIQETSIKTPDTSSCKQGQKWPEGKTKRDSDLVWMSWAGSCIQNQWEKHVQRIRTMKRSVQWRRARSYQGNRELSD